MDDKPSGLQIPWEVLTKRLDELKKELQASLPANKMLSYFEISVVSEDPKTRHSSTEYRLSWSEPFISMSATLSKKAPLVNAKRTKTDETLFNMVVQLQTEIASHVTAKNLVIGISILLQPVLPPTTFTSGAGETCSGWKPGFDPARGAWYWKIKENQNGECVWVWTDEKYP